MLRFYCKKQRGEGGLKKIKMLTVVDGRKGGWVKILKKVDDC